MKLDDMALEVYYTARDKGFWDGYEGNWHEDEDAYMKYYLVKLALIHSEVSEVLEALRKDKGEQNVVDEIADIIIRTLDFYAGLVKTGYTDIGLERSLLEKAGQNKNRPRKHGVRL